MTLPDLYFAFGSNLGTEQMATRCPGSSVFLRGELAGYRLAFLGTRSKWGEGGTATIVAAHGNGAPPATGAANAPGNTAHRPVNTAKAAGNTANAPEATVPGVLYRMTPADVEALNGFENFPTTYDHLLVEVAGEDGATYPAFTYQRTGAPPVNSPPMKYFHQIWRAYKDFGIDESALMEAVETCLNHGPDHAKQVRAP